MAAASRRSSSGPVLRSLSPSGRFYSSCYKTTPLSSPSSSFASAAPAFASSSLASRTSTLLHRSTSPTRVIVCKSTHSVPSVRFSLDRRPVSPNRSISVCSNRNQVVSKKPAAPVASAAGRKICLCAPTTHPGSFRCSLHKNGGNDGGGHASSSSSCNSSRLDARRSAMANSLVRIGAVEGDLVRRALAALIRPSSHQLRRRENFQRRLSRLSVMSKAEDL